VFFIKPAVVLAHGSVSVIGIKRRQVQARCRVFNQKPAVPDKSGAAFQKKK